jgi:hypothetical protein
MEVLRPANCGRNPEQADEEADNYSYKYKKRTEDRRKGYWGGLS